MRKNLKSRSLAGIILIIIGVFFSFVLAGDVEVKEGALTTETLKIGSSNGVKATSSYGALILKGEKASGYNEDLKFDFETTSNTVGISSSTGVTTMDFSAFSYMKMPTNAYFANSYITDSSGTLQMVSSNGTTSAGYNFSVPGVSYLSTLEVSGSAYIYELCYDYGDPKTETFSPVSASEAVNGVEFHVPPEKNGATLFFNKDINKLCVYIAGVIYPIQLENPIQAPNPTVEGEYEKVYRLDPMTGNVYSTQKPITKKFYIKEGYRLDEKTGIIYDPNGNVSDVSSARELK